MNLRFPLLAALSLTALCSHQALALSYCASDGQPTPIALLDRFMSADCEACWADARTPAPKRSVLALDWVLPSARGDEAPLSSVATRDALERLQALGASAPSIQAISVQTAVRASPGMPQFKLRVAHGLPVNDYIGTSIEAKPGTALRGRGALTAWLALVETIPAGTEGSPVERNLVRNLLMPAWNGAVVLSKEEQKRFYESRPMYVAQGAKPARLRVVGWLQDANGKVIAAAQSRCK